VRATIETDRLVLRPFESGDVEAAFAWFGDPIVTDLQRFISRAAFTIMAEVGHFDLRHEPRGHRDG
jgi:RimJ/RimL family protein N-acetyltransferase